MAKQTSKTKTTRTRSRKQKDPALKVVQERYPHITRVVATSKRTGRAIRVVIACQANYDDACEKEREIATQDAFQVTRCHSCQREYLKRRRRRNPDATAA